MDLLKKDGNYSFLDYLSIAFQLLTSSTQPKGVIYGAVNPLDILKIHKQRIEAQAKSVSSGAIVVEKKQEILGQYKQLATYHNNLINTYCQVIKQIITNSQKVQKIIRLSLDAKDPTEITEPVIYTLVCLLRNDLKISTLPTQIEEKTLTYLNQLKANLNDYKIDPKLFALSHI